MAKRKPRSALNKAVLHTKAGWARLPTSVRLLGKGLGVGLGGLGLVATAMEVPEMLRGGRDIAEDMGFDPTGRREQASQHYQNDLMTRLLGQGEPERELAFQESVDNQMGQLEAVSRDRDRIPDDDAGGLTQSRLLRQLLQGHEDELGAIQARAARTNEIEMIARRLGGL